jgi:hypothetical protein
VTASDAAFMQNYKRKLQIPDGASTTKMTSAIVDVILATAIIAIILTVNFYKL